MNYTLLAMLAEFFISPESQIHFERKRKMGDIRTIRVIEPSCADNQKLLRVAAYCRVSTQREEQESSLKSQVMYFTRLICENPEWKFAGVYAEQQSGLNISGRSELEKLLCECDAGRVDIVLMKSVSRLSRNTVDALKILNGVIENGIELRFDLENLSTKDKRVRQMFAMIAGIAQQESWSKSESIKWGMRHRASKGRAILNHSRFLGYTKDAVGQLVVVEDEAKIVRLIYELYLEGKGYRQIKKHLEQNDIKTVSGKTEWSTSTIGRMLSNEKYVGTLITQKSFVKDFLDGKQYKNIGEVEQQVFEEHHEAIVGQEVFERVQQEKQWRRCVKHGPE